MLVSKKLDFIIKQNENNKLSHAFLIETNNIESCLCDIKEIIKIINCPHEYNEDCNNDCNICTLIDNDNLPSLITIKPDGMSIKRNQMDELFDRFNTKPIYSKYNSYIIINAELMNQTSSNMLLKFLEEPNDFLIGFYITTDLNQILPTIKSRCEIITVNYESKSLLNEDIVTLANEYLDSIINSDDYMVNKDLILSKELERKDIQELFLCLFDIYKTKLEKCLQNNQDNSKVLCVIKLIEKELKLLQYNVNLELILDDFLIEMRRTHE